MLQTALWDIRAWSSRFLVNTLIKCLWVVHLYGVCVFMLGLSYIPVDKYVGAKNYYMLIILHRKSIIGVGTLLIFSVGIGKKLKRRIGIGSSLAFV